MSVLRDVAAGMNYMHAKRICHGDLNPSNILLKVKILSLIACDCNVNPIEAAGVLLQDVAPLPAYQTIANPTDREHAV
jgi:hypothetical protein